MNLCIIQARMGSTRFPGKVLQDVDGVPLLLYEIRRVKRARMIDDIVVATTTHSEDNAIEDMCIKNNIQVFRGEVDDVLGRYVHCAQQFPDSETLIRITGDCPLIDPALIDDAIEVFTEGDYDYVSNAGRETYPDGMDVEVFSRESLLWADQHATRPSQREHVTLYLREHPSVRKKYIESSPSYGHVRLTVDNKEDLEVIRYLVKEADEFAGYESYVALLEEHPEIAKLNQHIKRNEGLKKSLKEEQRHL